VLRWAVAFSRWDPLQDLLALQERINRLAGTDVPGWMPPVDVFETPDRFVVTVEVPGLSQSDFKIEVEGGRLTLKGERPCPERGAQFHRVERGHGQFSRTFALPQAIDPDKIAADLRAGILTITIPKAEAVRHHVEVR
jgi:HSP20 family protein